MDYFLFRVTFMDVSAKYDKPVRMDTFVEFQARLNTGDGGLNCLLSLTRFDIRCWSIFLDKQFLVPRKSVVQFDEQ
jgi:hypothetical protein